MGLFDRFKKKPSTEPAAEPRVQVYDVPTKTMSSMPARELGPGMVGTRMDGVDGDVWVAPGQLTASEYKHPSFGEDRLVYLRQIRDSLKDVYPLSLEQWEDGFRRDATPDSEIAIWVRIASVYASFASTATLSREERRDIFKVALSCANNPREQVLTVAGVQTLSRSKAEAVMAAFYGSSEQR